MVILCCERNDTETRLRLRNSRQKLAPPVVRGLDQLQYTMLIAGPYCYIGLLFIKLSDRYGATTVDQPISGWIRVNVEVWK